MQNSKKIEVRIYNNQNKLLKVFFMRKGGNLWVWLRKHQIPIGSACSGVGVCGACSVIIFEPEANRSEEKTVSLENELEKTTLLRNGKTVGTRLACMTKIYNNISIKAEYW